MEIENTDWNLVNEDDFIAIKCINHINLDIMGSVETSYRLRIGHSFKMFGNTYYALKSKDIPSACKEADEIAKKEFKELAAWYVGLYTEIGKSKSKPGSKGTIHSSELTTIVDLVCAYCGKDHNSRDANGHLISEEGKDYVFERKNGEEYCICTKCQKECNDKGL